MPTPDFNFLIYKTAEEDITVNAVIRDETIWLTQKAMSELFGVQTPAISKHLKSIFEEGELAQEVVVSKMEIPTPHGAMPGKTQMQTVMMYNLDAIISVGYRINSHRATQFRIWATGVLKEYMVKGFAMDDDRLKQFLDKRGGIYAHSGFQFSHLQDSRRRHYGKRCHSR